MRLYPSHKAFTGGAEHLQGVPMGGLLGEMHQNTVFKLNYVREVSFYSIFCALLKVAALMAPSE